MKRKSQKFLFSSLPHYFWRRAERTGYNRTKEKKQENEGMARERE